MQFASGRRSRATLRQTARPWAFRGHEKRPGLAATRLTFVFQRRPDPRRSSGPMRKTSGVWTTARRSGDSWLSGTLTQASSPGSQAEEVLGRLLYRCPCPNAFVKMPGCFSLMTFTQPPWLYDPPAMAPGQPGCSETACARQIVDSPTEPPRKKFPPPALARPTTQPQCNQNVTKT